jgi:AcrR family transcriptional regulator
MKTLKTPKTPRTADVGDALLQAARSSFFNEGFAGLSLRRVAEQAGCTTMAVYTRFGGKDGLVQVLFDEGFDQLRQAQAAVDPRLAPAARVLALCLAYRQTAHTFPHHYALMLGAHGSGFEPSAQSRQRSASTLTTLVDAVAATLPKTRQRQARATALAHRVLALCHGWVSLEQLGLVTGKPADQEKAFTQAVNALLVA